MASIKQITETLSPKTIGSVLVASFVLGVIGVVANWWTQGQFNDAVITVGGYIWLGLTAAVSALGALLGAIMGAVG